MVSLLSQTTSINSFHRTPFFTPSHVLHNRVSRVKLRTPRFYIPVNSTDKNSLRSNDGTYQNEQKPLPRTVYPGGFKRPEIKVPTVVLQLDPNEVLAGGDVLEVIDEAVSKCVGIVLLDGGEGNGGRLYEAACSLKSVINDRAYFMISERVDIAAAVGANGVLLSDQGIPAIVARKTLTDSKSESVYLPLVARNVQSAKAALNASNSEGADFLIYVSNGDEGAEVKSVFENVKIPVFTMVSLCGDGKSYNAASKLLNLGASGFVISLEGFKFFYEKVLSKLSVFDHTMDKTNKIKALDVNNGSYGDMNVADLIELEDRGRQFVEAEKAVLREAIKVIQKASPLVIF